MSVFHRLGFSIACEKVEGPTPCLEFLGFILDSQALEVWLSQTKLLELQSTIHQWVGRKMCERRELESLEGKLVHAAKVVKLRRTFLRRMFELLGGGGGGGGDDGLTTIFDLVRPSGLTFCDGIVSSLPGMVAL